MGRNNTKSEKILNLLNKKEASLKEIKHQIGPDYQYNLNKLLTDGKIRVSGYKPTAKNFKCEQILFEKIDPGEKSPIHIMRLIDDVYDDPKSEETLFTIFKERFEELSKRIIEEEQLFNEHLNKMPIKEMLKLIEPSQKLCPPLWNQLVKTEQEYPNSQIWYLTKHLEADVHELKKHLPIRYDGETIFIIKGIVGIDYDGTVLKNEFIWNIVRTNKYWDDLRMMAKYHPGFKKIKSLFYDAIRYINLHTNDMAEKMNLANSLSDYGDLEDFQEFLIRLLSWIKTE